MSEISNFLSRGNNFSNEHLYGMQKYEYVLSYVIFGDQSLALLASLWSLRYSTKLESASKHALKITKLTKASTNHCLLEFSLKCMHPHLLNQFFLYGTYGFEMHPLFRVSPVHGCK